VVWRCVRGWNPLTTFSTIREQCFAATECLCELIEKLKNGRTSVMHEERAGRPSTTTTDDNIECVRDMVLLDRWADCWWSGKSSANYEKWCYYKLSTFIEVKVVSLVRTHLRTKGSASYVVWSMRMFILTVSVGFLMVRMTQSSSFLFKYLSLPQLVSFHQCLTSFFIHPLTTVYKLGKWPVDKMKHFFLYF
jgi:hypothetical protein